MTWQLHPGSSFSEHAPAWDALQLRCTNTPFLESLFLQPLLKEFGTGQEMIALHHEGAELSAAAIVRPRGLGVWETFQPSQLPLGPFVAAPGQALQPLLHSLIKALPGLALGLGATQLDPRLTPRPAPTISLRLMDYIDTPYIDVAGDWADYWAARGKNLRQNMRKQHHKLTAEGSVPRLDCITDPQLVAAALADYGKLEIAGWKADGGTAIHPDNAQGRFYQAMLQNFCAAGRGRIYRYRFGEQVVAMDLCIDNGPLVVILKTAYDESIRTLSPSTLMRHDKFEAWWGEGRYQRIEFYGKTMDWHTRWTESQRRLYHATAYRWPFVSAAYQMLKGLQARAAQAGGSGKGSQMKLVLLLRALGLALLMAAALPALAQASTAVTSTQITRGEYHVLPEYCPDTQGGPNGALSAPNARKWVALMGADFWHMHHYCWGLRDMLRLRQAGLTPNERQMLMGRAVGDFEYVLNRVQPTMPLLPEVLLKKGEVHEMQGNLSAALEAFAASMKFKPDYWPAYDRTVSIYLGLKQTDKALAVAERGLLASPNQPNLLALVQAIKNTRTNSAPAKPTHPASGSGR